MTQLLLDTHALLWWWSGDASLSSVAKAAIADADATVYVSAASAWEIATKVRLGRLRAHGTSSLDSVSWPLRRISGTLP